MPENQDDRLKRLRMRCWRRGMKEMDLILGPFADARLAGLDDPSLSLLEAMMEENDQDLFQWATGQAAAPPHFATLMASISAFARRRLTEGKP